MKGGDIGYRLTIEEIEGRETCEIEISRILYTLSVKKKDKENEQEEEEEEEEEKE
jgi:hypothetical protein